MKKYEFEIYFTLLILMSLTLFTLIFQMFSYRHTMINGKVYKAIHIMYPGYTTWYKPADTINLEKWVGSGISGLKITVSGKENPEMEASVALKSLGIADSSYYLKLVGEHYVLISPEKSWDVWDWKSYHRISSWVYDKELNKH